MNLKTAMRSVGAVLLAAVAIAGQVLVATVLAGSGALLAFPSVGTTANVDGNVNEAMKIIFEDPLTNSIVQESEMLDIFEQDMDVEINQTTGGRYIEMAHYFTLPSGVGARRLEGDYIPVPGGPVIRNSQVYLKKVEGVVQMTGDTMRRVKSGEGGFTNWAQQHLPDLRKRVDSELDRMLFGDGSGVKALVNDADPDDGDQTLGIDSLYGFAGYLDPWLAFMEEGEIVFGPNRDGSNLRNSGQAYEIDQIDPDNNELDLNSEPTAAVADDDYIFAGDSAGDSSAGGGRDREIMGLLGMVDDGGILTTFQGLNRNNFRKWNGQVLDASQAPYSGNMTEDLLDAADRRVFMRATEDIDILIMSRAAQAALWRNIKTDRRLNDPRGSVQGGRNPLTMQFGDREVEIRTPRKCPRNTVFGLTQETFKHWRNTGWEWDDLTGSIWNRVTDGTGRKDTFYAVGHIVLQTGCVAPYKNIRIDGLDVPA